MGAVNFAFRVFHYLRVALIAMSVRQRPIPLPVVRETAAGECPPCRPPDRAGPGVEVAGKTFQPRQRPLVPAALHFHADDRPAVPEDEIDFEIALPPVGHCHSRRRGIAQMRADGGFDQPSPQFAVLPRGDEAQRCISRSRRRIGDKTNPRQAGFRRRAHDQCNALVARVAVGADMQFGLRLLFRRHCEA